jgi:uncharacterized SAM-binding protein YcdF (DUF218 family)
VFVFLSKLLSPLVYPLGLALLLWVAGAILRRTGRERAGNRSLVAGAAVVLLASQPLVGATLLGSLESHAPAAPAASYPEVDAVVVLGGITASPKGPRLEVEVNEGFDRLLHGQRLLQAGRAPVLLLAGGGIRYLTGTSLPEAERMARLAAQMGLPRERLLLETRSRNTYENGLYAAQLLRERGWSRILLVTSASHMRRAEGVFRKQGLEVIAAPTDFDIVSRPFVPMRLMPDVTALQQTTRATKEYVGLFVYWLRGYL